MGTLDQQLFTSETGEAASPLTQQGPCFLAFADVEGDTEKGLSDPIACMIALSLNASCSCLQILHITNSEVEILHI